MGTFIFGLTMGSILMTQSLLTAECFGMVSFGVVSGLMGMFVAAGAAIGPAIAGRIYDATQQLPFGLHLVCRRERAGRGGRPFRQTAVDIPMRR